MTFEPLTPERRRAMTRQHLLDAAAVVFARAGFHGATIDEIAKTAGFTKGAVYSNFTSKDDLFLALLDDRIDRQFAIVAEVLESIPHEQAEQAPRMRDLLQSGAVFSDDAWETLSLEFILYARRNPEAAAKLAARAERERDFVRQMMEQEYAAVGATPTYPIRELALISLAIFAGLSSFRMINPGSVTETTIDTVLDLLFDVMGVPDESE
ncbi:MAG: TetR family transcriptional regulator [Acidimicrobiia bacterium]